MDRLEVRMPLVTDQDSQVGAILNLTKSILEDVSDYELNMIRDSMRIIMMEPPSTKLLVTERISQLTACKSDLQYLMLKIRDIRRSYNIPFVNQYNTMFTLGTKKGLPSKQAIESEMYHMSADMRAYRDKLDDIDSLVGFLDSYSSLIDSTIRTLENRRYDLG